MRTRFSRYGMIAAATFAAAGCAEKLTYERWQTIHNGAPPAAVEQTLGEPWEKLEMAWEYHDADRLITAAIYFQNDQVIGKTWEDPEHGMRGENPNVSQPGDAHEVRINKLNE